MWLCIFIQTSRLYGRLFSNTYICMLLLQRERTLDMDLWFFYQWGYKQRSFYIFFPPYHVSIRMIKGVISFLEKNIALLMNGWWCVRYLIHVHVIKEILCLFSNVGAFSHDAASIHILKIAFLQVFALSLEGRHRAWLRKKTWTRRVYHTNKPGT